jgi:hypothetical protein
MARKLPNPYNVGYLRRHHVISKENQRTMDAPAVMKEQGKETDELVYTYVRENPNSTIKEIAEHYDISNGRADHSVNRLKEQGLVEVNYFKRNRGLVKKVRAADAETTPFDEVSFPLAGLDENKWKEDAYICALSRSAIRVSPTLRDEWKDECIMVQKSSLVKDGDRLKFKLPEKFVDFYEVPNSEVDVSGSGDEILLTVESTIIPVELPYDYKPKG